MHPILDVLTISNALFNCRAGSFPLYRCTYVPLNANGNDTADLEQIAVLRFTAMHGERFRLRASDDIQRFLATVGRLTGEVVS